MLQHWPSVRCRKKWHKEAEAQASVFWFMIWLVNTNVHYCCWSKPTYHGCMEPRTSLSFLLPAQGQHWWAPKEHKRQPCLLLLSPHLGSYPCNSSQARKVRVGVSTLCKLWERRQRHVAVNSTLAWNNFLKTRASGTCDKDGKTILLPRLQYHYQYHSISSSF